MDHDFMVGPRGKKKSSKKSKHFLLDIGYDTPQFFLKALLSTGQFTPSMLGHIGGKGATKDERASRAAECLLSDESLMEELMNKYCVQPRQWLLMRTGQVDSIFPNRSLKSANSFFTQSKSRGWHGPFAIEDQKKAWYIYVHLEPNLLPLIEGAPVVQAPVRWDLAAEVTPSYMAVHWNGFSVRDTSHQHSIQFGYWRHMPRIIAELQSALGDPDWEDINLHKIVLHELMETHDVENGGWHHKRIRAQRGSVAINASGGKMTRSGHISLGAQSGFRKLTHTLARSAAKVVNITDKADITKMERALLHTIVRDMGARAYEFDLENAANPGMRMYCYFGAAAIPEGGMAQGQDAFQHIRCFRKRGGSTGTRDFLIHHLGL